MDSIMLAFGAVSGVGALPALRGRALSRRLAPAWRLHAATAPYPPPRGMHGRDLPRERGSLRG